ncbi:Xaa-Pro peptidase family protein [Verrucomicrobiales bacterium]|nr:Xaa-Pro peptidase family protein [Verrucomicrobiales bacterium]MDB4358773.1 Xaa-Pro peptidase family protein [Verrucomicrobiales bacterium]
MSTFPRSTIRAGIPQENSALFHATQFAVGDPVVYLEIENQGTTCIVRDVELDRALSAVEADRIAVPADFTPEGGLSADREIATAQSAAECLKQSGISTITAHRSLPLSFAHVLREAGIEVICDLDFGIRERRQKNESEIEKLRQSQAVTEEAIAMACQMIARADAAANGTLIVEGTPLTSERVHAAINIFLMERGFSGPQYIVSGGSQGASCHHHGDGELRTGQPVIVDIFPTSQATHYCGDCTRTVVHGEIPSEIAEMHAAVFAAKIAGCAAIRPGVTGAEVHAATTKELTDRGFHTGFPPENASLSFCTMPHGTGHGIGLDVHEPPLLDATGIELLKGDALTVEPGLYRKDLGGVRLEDMVVVTEDGIENLNRLPESLNWK